MKSEANACRATEVRSADLQAHALNKTRKRGPSRCHTRSHSSPPPLLSLPHSHSLLFCARSERRRGGKNEEEVGSAARFVPANAGLLIRRQSGHPIIQVSLNGNEESAAAEHNSNKYPAVGAWESGLPSAAFTRLAWWIGRLGCRIRADRVSIIILHYRLSSATPPLTPCAATITRSTALSLRWILGRTLDKNKKVS